MEIQAEHNLTNEELSKALHGLAEAEGISEELVKALRKTSACDDTPKEPRDPAVRHLYQMLRNEFAKARQDIERYAEALVSLRKSQLAFDFSAHHSAYDRVDPRTGKLEHIEAKGQQRHSVPEASPVVEHKPQEATGMDRNEKDDFFEPNQKTGYYIECLEKMGCPKELLDLAKELASSKKPIDRKDESEDKSEQQIVRWDKSKLYYLSKGEWGFQRIQIEPDNGYVDFGEGYPAKDKPKAADLREQLEAYKPELANTIERQVFATVQSLKETYGPDMRGKNWQGQKASQSKAWERYRSLTTRDPDGNVEPVHELMADYALAQAGAVVDAWGEKITSKLSDLQNTTVRHLDGHRFAITGERDGKKIRIEQDMIINYSALGTAYNQFPARIYVDGKFHPEAAYKKLIGTDKVEQAAKDAKAAEKRAKNMLPSGMFAKGDKVKLKLVRANSEKYETEGTVESEKDGKTMVKYGSNRFNMHGIRIDTDKLKRWNP